MKIAEQQHEEPLKMGKLYMCKKKDFWIYRDLDHFFCSERLSVDALYSVDCHAFPPLILLPRREPFLFLQILLEGKEYSVVEQWFQVIYKGVIGVVYSGSKVVDLLQPFEAME